MNPPPTEAFDVVLAGGGLASSLIALRLRARHPGLRVAMLEQAPEVADSHTWCLFETDVPEEAWRWLSPLFEHRWRDYEVAFPDYARRLSTGYARLASRRLARAVEAALGPDMRRGVRVARVLSDRAVAADGREFHAPLVIDGRGNGPAASLRLGWQKFYGVHLCLSRPHGLARPLVMDARVPQIDGFRFVYVLPVGPAEALVEDTRYSDSPLLDPSAFHEAVRAYAERRRGWEIVAEGRREQGVLPVVLSGDIDRFWQDRDAGVPAVGMRAALFHPTTGYSLPDAARTADLVAAEPVLASAPVAARLEARSKELWAERAFYRGLNRMMFTAAAPAERFRILQRFYTLAQPRIERFYADRLSLTDKMRILTGRPPVPMRRALGALQASDRAPSHA
jgi:lycopene beta-cyclase